MEEGRLLPSSSSSSSSCRGGGGSSATLLVQQLQAAAAAVNIARQPVLMVDPLGLLLSVLGAGPGGPGQQDLVGQAFEGSSSSIKQRGSAAGPGGPGQHDTVGRVVAGNSNSSKYDVPRGSGAEGGMGWVVIQPNSSSWGARYEGGRRSGSVANSGAAPDGTATAVDGATAAASAALAAGNDVCLQLHSIAAETEILIVQAVAAWHGVQLPRQAGTSSSGTQGLGGDATASGLSNQSASFKSLSSIKAQKGGPKAVKAAAAGTPRLLVHLTSPCGTVPAELAGLLGVMSIGAGEQLAAAAASGAGGGSSSGPPAGYKQKGEAAGQPPDNQTQENQQWQLVQLVQMLVLHVVDKKGWQAALDALQAAGNAQQETVETEAALLLHAAQVSTKPPCHVMLCTCTRPLSCSLLPWSVPLHHPAQTQCCDLPHRGCSPYIPVAIARASSY